MLETIEIMKTPNCIIITLNRVDQRNSINELMLDELHEQIDMIEESDSYKMLIIQGKEGVFCTGLDFGIFNSELSDYDKGNKNFCKKYMALLHRLSTLPRIVISRVDGEVMAGGIGLLAVSDIVVASDNSTFILSETLWGLLPSMVLPYLIRRIGFQNAYRMTLTASRIDARQAKKIVLIDEISKDSNRYIKTLSIKFSRITIETIKELKQYFRKLWIINEQTENLGIEETFYLASKDKVQQDIANFTKYKIFPWET